MQDYNVHKKYIITQITFYLQPSFTNHQAGGTHDGTITDPRQENDRHDKP